MGNLTVAFNDYIELMGVLSHLTTYYERVNALCNQDKPLKPCRNALYYKALEYFDKYKSMPAVTLFEELTKEFMFDAPVYFFLRMGKYRDLPYEKVVDKEILSRCKVENHGLLKEIFNAAKAFYEETDFEKYLDDNKTIYQNIISDITKALDAADCISVFEKYLGLSHRQYTLIPAPLVIGNYGIHFADSGYIQAYPVICPIYHNELDFGNSIHLSYILWHETGHSFINPITSRYIDRITINIDSTASYYNTNETMINEHIIRAIVVRLTTIVFGEEEGKRELKRNNELGYKYINKTVELLQVYEKSRERYKTIDDYYETILKAFE